MIKEFGMDAAAIKEIQKQYPTPEELLLQKKKEDLAMQARMNRHAMQKTGKSKEIEFHQEIFTIMAGKATELQWYMFETRIRQIVQEIVEPLSSKQTDINQQFVGQNSDFAILKRRVEELEFIFQKVQRQSATFDELKQGQDKFGVDIKNQVLNIRNELALNIDRINKQDEDVRASRKLVDQIVIKMEDIKLQFQDTVKAAQDINNQSQALSIQIKDECMDMLYEFKKRIADVDRVKTEVLHLQDSITMDVEKLDKQIEINQKQYLNDKVEMKENINEVQRQMKKSWGIANKDLEFLKSTQSKLDKEFRNVEFYLNRILPSLQYSQLSNVLHYIIRDKQSYNHLLEYDYKILEFLKDKVIFGPKSREKATLNINYPDRPNLKQFKRFKIC